MFTIDGHEIVKTKMEGTKLSVYTADVPNPNPVNGEIPIENNLLGINLKIDYYTLTETATPAYEGFGGDYDVLIHALTPIRIAKFGIGAVGTDKGIIDVRSDKLFFMHTMFCEQPCELVTMPTGAVAVTHYYSNLYVPLRINRGQSEYYWYEFDLAAEADYVGTVANNTTTSIEFTFTNLYTNDEVSTIHFSCGDTEQINSTTGHLLTTRDGLKAGSVIGGMVVSGEMEGTEDLSKLTIEHAGKTIFNEDINNQWSTIKWYTHNQVDKTDICNLMIAVFKPFRIDASTKINLFTTAGQDFNILWIWTDI